MTRQQKDEWRKEQIRAAATRCFVRRGFAATRLLDIAKEAGLSKGGVYFHYRAKETLFQDILDAQLKTIETRWSFEPAGDQPADQTLKRLIQVHLQTIEDEPDETRIGHLLVSMAPQDATFRAKLEEAFSVVRTLYAGVIRRGIEDGIFVAGDPEQLAQCVMAMVQGLSSHGSVHEDGHLPVRPDVAANTVLRMVMRDPTRISVEAPATAEASEPVQPAVLAAPPVEPPAAVDLSVADEARLPRWT